MAPLDFMADFSWCNLFRRDQCVIHGKRHATVWSAFYGHNLPRLQHPFKLLKCPCSAAGDGQWSMVESYRILDLHCWNHVWNRYPCRGRERLSQRGRRHGVGEHHFPWGRVSLWSREDGLCVFHVQWDHPKLDRHRSIIPKISKPVWKQNDRWLFGLTVQFEVKKVSRLTFFAGMLAFDVLASIGNSQI